jgi:hypothetical protein
MKKRRKNQVAVAQENKKKGREMGNSHLLKRKKKKLVNC